MNHVFNFTFFIKCCFNGWNVLCYGPCGFHSLNMETRRFDYILDKILFQWLNVIWISFHAFCISILTVFERSLKWFEFNLDLRKCEYVFFLLFNLLYAASLPAVESQKEKQSLEFGDPLRVKVLWKNQQISYSRVYSHSVSVTYAVHSNV